MDDSRAPIRFLRQVLVAGFGDEGQARLFRTEAPFGGEGLAHEIATTYATRAGVSRVVRGNLDEAGLCPEFLTIPAARSVLSGARAALAVFRSPRTTKEDVP